MNSSPASSQSFQTDSSESSSLPPPAHSWRAGAASVRREKARPGSPAALHAASEPLPRLVSLSPAGAREDRSVFCKKRHSPLALWHLLSLDAPTVASIWTLFIARCCHVELPWTSTAATFLAVWMIYSTDRLFDARLLDLGLPANLLSVGLLEMRDRHYFHHRHRRGFLVVILLASLALTPLLCSLDPGSLYRYAVLATLLAAWMLMIHVRPLPASARGRPRLRPLPKELAVGIFFPAAIFIPTLARTVPAPQAAHLLGHAAIWLRPSLLPSAILLACICTLNCLYLYCWEHPSAEDSISGGKPDFEIDRRSLSQAAGLLPHWSTRWGLHYLQPFAWTTLALSTLIAVACRRFGYPGMQATELPALACALSAAALITLDRLRRKLSPIHLRGAADLVLLTPLLLLFLMR